MDENLLQEAGLTDGESKVYLALLELGTSATGPIVEKSGISASKVYFILDRLAKKGLTGHVVKKGVRYFQATAPRRIIDYLDEREQELEAKKQKITQLLPQLELMQSMSSEKRQAEIYEGTRGITNLFRTMIDELKSGEEYFVIGAANSSYLQPGIRAFFQQYHAERARRNIKVNMLANQDIKATLVPSTKLKSEIRYLPQSLISTIQITFYKNKTFIILWSNNPMAFLIHNSEVVDGFRRYFNLLWKQAKK